MLASYRIQNVKNNNILVTGGAGYIGSVTAEELLKAGYSVVVLDNLSEGHREAVPKGVPFYQGNVGDAALLARIFSEHKIAAVMHFAALALVGESVKYPERYHENNVVQTVTLLDSMREHDVTTFIFSSSCSVFGEPRHLPITEDHPQAPINPYGETKLEVERILRERQEQYGLRSCSLRYFNAAGATARNGEDRKMETHLIPLVLDTALGKRERVEIYGTDYPTPDGTCIRDYIHVVDLARAHIGALDYLAAHPAGSFNLGNGIGYSVKQVVETAGKITGRVIPAVERARRPGDPARLVGSSELAQKELRWKIRYPELESIIESAWRWRREHPEGYSS
jgi:UDP-glucose 4-epimerase